MRFTCNGRDYEPPSRPIVAICLDGCADEYLDAALTVGAMPNLAGMIQHGYRGMVRGALPSFTNVNNSSIVTGTPPSVHGIGGNYFLDPQTDEEVMTHSSSFLRVGTILAAASESGRQVGFVTAKDKLREMLSAGLKGIAFSAEKATEALVETHGIDQVEAMVGRPAPAIYSADASLYALEAGACLLKDGRSDFLYLSTTDYMQHKFGYSDPEIVDFYGRIDEILGWLINLDAIVGITADHGMNAKQRLDGSPNVTYLETALREKFGESVRVVLPITDPYVVHHGALGSFAVVHLGQELDLQEVHEFAFGLPGVTEVHDRTHAAEKLELPQDRIGDLVVLSGRDFALGKDEGWHDLGALEGGLRSHGGRYEEMVPMIVSEPLSPEYFQRAQSDPRNFDLFDFLCNGVVK